LITRPIEGAPGAGAPNPLGRDAQLKDQDPTPEKFESVGIVVDMAILGFPTSVI
jgi:hypothetical protein